MGCITTSEGWHAYVVMDSVLEKVDGEGIGSPG